VQTIALLLVLLGLVAGCGTVPVNPSASPDTSLQADCDRRACHWNRNANVCESPLYRW
jgi:hypothetical protein